MRYILRNVYMSEKCDSAIAWKIFRKTCRKICRNTFCAMTVILRYTGYRKKWLGRRAQRPSVNDLLKTKVSIFVYLGLLLSLPIFVNIFYGLPYRKPFQDQHVNVPFFINNLHGIISKSVVVVVDLPETKLCCSTTVLDRSFLVTTN